MIFKKKITDKIYLSEPRDYDSETDEFQFDAAKKLSVQCFLILLLHSFQR